MSDNTEMNEQNNMYASLGALNKDSIVATSELSTKLNAMQESIRSKQDISALLADVSSIVLSSASEWVKTNQSDWDLDRQPEYAGNNIWVATCIHKDGTRSPVEADGNEDATTLHFVAVEIDIYAEKKYRNALSIVTYDYLADKLSAINFNDENAATTISFGQQTISALVFGDFVLSDHIGSNAMNSVKQVNLGTGVTSIGWTSFKGCSSLSSILIPGSVKQIKASAFEGCSKLSSIIMPDSIASIGGGAFYGCSKLNSFIIGDGVTAIADSVFSGCSSLKYVVIPENVVSCGNTMFYGCNALEKIIVRGKTQSEAEAMLANTWYTNIDGCQVVTYLESSAANMISAALNAVEVEYTELVQLRDSSTLVPGTKYRITDFVTTVDQEGCRSAGHPFDIVVVAVSSSKLDEKAIATLPSNGDNYFNARPYHIQAYQNYIEYKRVPLESWELKYCLDNDKTRFQWADEANGKGVIWQMKDEFGNEAPYDFKNVQFKRCLVTSSAFDQLNGMYSLNIPENSGIAIDEEDFEWCYTFNGIDYASKGLNEPYDFSGLYVSPTDAVISQLPSAYVRRLNCCAQNVVHEMYKDDSSMLLNTMRLPNNVFQCKMDMAIDGISQEYSQLFQVGCCMQNVVGANACNNTFNDNSNNNQIGYGCCQNVFGSNCDRNIFGNSCYGNILGNDNDQNVFSNDCSTNTFSSNCDMNTLGNECSNNTLNADCAHNVFGSDCDSNILSANCDSNIFGNGCNRNALGSKCCSNTFGSYCCDSTFGNYCCNNTFGDDCNYIVFGSSSSVTPATAKSYCRYINIASGNQHIVLNATSQTASDSYYQNVDIKPGVNNTTTWKTIDDGNVNQSFTTAYSSTIAVSGSISASNDIIACSHGLVGKDVDFSTGGLENFGVGHSHKFYGKESFAVHDGNIVGAKGFYWKAIIKVPDSSSYLIYLQSAKHEYEHTHMFDIRCMPLVQQLNIALWCGQNSAYDCPYFGLSSDMAEDNRAKLLSAEPDVNINGVVGKYVTVVNCRHEKYLRWLQVKDVLSGSVLSCEELYSQDDAIKTYYRKSSAHSYHDNQYLVFFSTDDNNEKSSQASITCDDGAYVTSTTFGATALGDANTVFGYNAFASGKDNKAIGAWSTAMGTYNKAYGYNSIAVGDYSDVSANYAFAWNGIPFSSGSYKVPYERAGTFNINPNGGLSGFYIGNDNFIDNVLAAIKTLPDDKKVELRNAISAAAQ